MVVKVENLVKRYDDAIALEHFNMEVIDGEILGLLGPNGCGKTTAINCILGLLNFDKGNIKIFDREMKPDAYDIKRRIGIVPQDVSVFYNLTVYENIDYFCGLYIDNKDKRKEYVEEAIGFVGLEKYRDLYSQNLSGGLKRRLNIACGISHKPDLIFLDEPTVAVDAQSRNFILDGIKNLNINGASIVYTTHYLEEAEDLCDRIIIMDRGKNLVVGTIDELKNMISTSEKIIVEFRQTEDYLESDILELPYVRDIEVVDRNYIIRFDKGHNNLSTLIKYIEENNLIYENLYSKSPSLNDVFLELTGKELRD